MKKTALNLFFIALFTITSSKQTEALNPPSPKTINLRILNYNIWHGLTPKNKFQMEYLEGGTKKRFQKRVEAQIREIKSLNPKPDIIFLQEANYVEPISQKFSKNLDMDAVYQVDLCGVKLFFNFLSVPQKICSGLVILARRDLKLKKIAGKKLSGTGFCSYTFCIQWAETRYAQKAIIQLKGLPHKIILANTHLHHGFNAGKAIKKLRKRNLRPEIKSFLEERFKEGEKKRLGEVENLRKFLAKDTQDKKVLGVILAGDFNDTPQSETVIRMKDLGFVPSYEAAGIKNPLFTFNSKNKNIKNYVHKFKHPYEYPENTQEDEKQEIKDLLLNIDLGSRKIDYIFLHKKLLENDLLKIKGVKLFGNKKVRSSDKKLLLMSDHFGIYIDLEIDINKSQGS